MAKHSKTAYDESEAIRDLSSFLENGHKIKTFFSENDRTPNHDGFFELCNNVEDEPKKQFIVQIKKVENLKPEIVGKNKGKYKYSLKTNFLNCVKNRAFENPAIYFVVDIKTKNIFWIYLSDEKLINMKIDNKKNITYYFNQDEICTNINDFTNILDEIVNKRNEVFFIEKTEVIAEVQKAVDTLNNLLNWDLNFIKKLMFGDIWRFGISYSNPTTSSLTINNETFTNEAVGFSLYIHELGQKDYGYKKTKMLIDFENMFKFVDMTEAPTPEKYVKDVISQILQQFFNSHLIIEILPEIIITEILRTFIIKFEELCKIKVNATISEIETTFKLSLMYVDKILSDKNESEQEKSLKNKLLEEISYINNTPYTSYRIDLLEEIYNCGCRDFFDSFCKKMSETDIKSYPDCNILDYLSVEYSEYYSAIKRAKELKMEVIDMTKQYKKVSFDCASQKDKYNKVRQFCKKWFKDLVNIYIQVYNDIFKDKKYFVCGHFEYEIRKPAIKDVAWKFIKYQSNSFDVKEYKSDIDINQIVIDGNVIGKYSGCNLKDFVQDKTPLYHSIKCLLYQGISRELQIQCKGIDFNNSNNAIFE